MDLMDLPDSLQQAIDVAQSGDKGAASRLLAQYVTQDPRNDIAWLWLAACLDEPDQQRYCLSKATALNPNNPDTLSGLFDLVNPPWAHAQPARPIELPPVEPFWSPEPEPEPIAIPESRFAQDLFNASEPEPQPAQPDIEPFAAPDSHYADDLFAQPEREPVPVMDPEPALEAEETPSAPTKGRFSKTQITILLVLTVGILLVLAVLGYFLIFVSPDALPTFIRSIFTQGSVILPVMR